MEVRNVERPDPFPLRGSVLFQGDALNVLQRLPSDSVQCVVTLANSGLILKVHLQKMWGPTFVEAWDLLETWVKHRRLKKREPLDLRDGAFSRNDFEKFALECKRA